MIMPCYGEARWVRIKWLCSVGIVLLGVYGCVQKPDEVAGETELVLAADIRDLSAFTTAQPVVTKVNWDAVEQQLEVQGKAKSSTVITIVNPETQATLGRVETTDEDEWNLNITDLVSIPCSIDIQANGTNQVKNVAQAPKHCSGNRVAANGATLEISSATWRADSYRLEVRGVGAAPQQMVHVFDALDGKLLGSDRANVLGVWKVKALDVISSPCMITVIADVYVAQIQVSGSTTCSPTGDPISSEPGFNQAPNATITAPRTDLTIKMGDSIEFLGTGYDSDNNNPLTYIWRFGDGIPETSVQNPGTIKFDKPGVYTVSLTVIDALKNQDPTPDTRMIIVENNTPSNNQAPQSHIVSPANDQAISLGQSVNFAGLGSDPEKNTPLSYRWDFSGVTANSSVQSPGNVVFNRAGVFVVKLSVVDSLGNIDATPAVRMITVTQNASSDNRPPNGEMVKPNTDISIATGEFVAFIGNATDPDNDLPFTYAWDFGGGAPNSIQKNPDNIVFNQPGRYTVSYRVTDSRGMQDPSPAIRVITVFGNANNPNPVTPPNHSTTIIAPETTIASPGANQTIQVGQALNFSGFGIDPNENNPINYYWDFDGAMPNTRVQNPGEIFFTQPGNYRIRLTAIDSLGNQDMTPAVVNVVVRGAGQTNSPPTVQMVAPVLETSVISVGDTLSFNATATDPDNHVPLQYFWDFGGAAPNVTTANPGNITFHRSGQYRVTLRVKDGLGLASAAIEQRTVVVQNTVNVNEAPIGIIASPVLDVVIHAGDSVDFNGMGYDAENAGLNYRWLFGNNAVPETSNIQNPGLVRFTQPGQYSVSLQVTDRSQQSALVAMRNIWVRSTDVARAPQSTIVSPNSTVVRLGQSLPFVGSATDPNNLATSYYWDFDGASVDQVGANLSSIVFYRVGVYNIRLHVTNSLFLSDTSPDVRVISVIGEGSLSTVLPVGSILTPEQDVTVPLGGMVNFNASATDADNNLPIFYRWNFGGLTAASNIQNPGVVYMDKVGTYQVHLTVTDSTGASSATPDTVTITVTPPLVASPPSHGSNPTNPSNPNDSAPNGTIISPPSNLSINVGESVNFESLAMDPGNNIPVSYRWVFEGSVISESNLKNPGLVRFDRPGTFRIRLQVTDSLGNQDPTADVRVITVIGNTNSTGSVPNGVITMPANNITMNAGSALHFMAMALVPNTNGEEFTYLWDFDGAAVNQNMQSPGDIIFNTPGIYRVKLTVTSNVFGRDLTPTERLITVN